VSASILALNFLRRAVERLIKAEIANDGKGGGDPARIPAIEQELAQARDNYQRALKRLEE
jgi:hypothetical protein